MALAANSVIISHNAAFTSFDFPSSKFISNLHSHSLSHFQRIPRITITTTPSSSSSIAKATLSDVQLQDHKNNTFNTTSTTTWSEFATNVSGEWDGFGAEFTNEGNPIELPESVVPEAYREWEVKVLDWQTQCPTLAQPEEPLLIYKSIKLLPTVGCEADAATRYSIDERSIGGQDDKVSAFAYQASGSYVAVWPSESNSSLELEYCLVNPQDRESRVRIIQLVNVDDRKMVIQKVRVFREQWYGPFRNGEQLGGCAIRDSGFAATDAMEASDVVGVWQGPRAVAKFDAFHTDLLQELRDDGVMKSVRDECDLILLPKQLWCSLKQSTDGETCSEVGWLFDNGQEITSSCIFSAAKLKFISNLHSHSLSHFQRIPRITITTTPSSSSSIAKATLSDVQLQDHKNNTFNTTSTTTWSEFATNVSGEWDGFGAEFTNEGNPIELPESVVPEAYREWEVKVLDWQTQCPTLAQPEEPLLIYKSIKLLPTVGCEADAATRYSIDERSIGGQDDKVSAFAYQASGSYVAVWPSESNSSLELEYCLVNPQDRESRVRIIQLVNVDDRKMVIQKVRVFREQWYGPFRNGEQLGGCAIRDSGFAATDAMEASDVVGVWQGPRAVAKFDAFHTDLLQELRDDGVMKSVRDECDLILLPKQLWCSLKQSTDGETCSEVGWLFDNGQEITSSCIFSAAKLKGVSIARETRAAEGV
nr:hypothetical protein CFP56_65663 [Quercus suber]